MQGPWSGKTTTTTLSTYIKIQTHQKSAGSELAVEGYAVRTVGVRRSGVLYGLQQGLYADGCTQIDHFHLAPAPFMRNLLCVGVICN